MPLLRFTKANTTVGHDAFWLASNARVLVKPTELAPPLYPENPAFWSEFRGVMDKVCMAKEANQGGFTAGVSSANEAAGVVTAQLAANYVHKDRPSQIMTWVAKQVTSPWRVLPHNVPSNFIDRITLLHALLGQGGLVSFPSTFCAKWHFMVPRPEEVAGAIARNEIAAPDFIKDQLFDSFSQATLSTNQKSFAFYPEGCPPHPSYPGGHATHAGYEATVLKLMYNLTPTDMRNVNLSAMNIAHFREIAGVHYRQDDVVGLMIGELCAKRYLPGWFQTNLGIPSATISAILDTINTDWGAMLA